MVTKYIQLTLPLIYHLCDPCDEQVLVRVERIDHMDVKSETLTFTSYVGLVWQDDNLRWGPESGVYQLILDPDRIWTPPIIPLGVIEYKFLNDQKPQVGLS